MQEWEQKGRQHNKTEPEGKQEGRAAVRERLGQKPQGGGDFEEASLAVERERSLSDITK